MTIFTQKLSKLIEEKVEKKFIESNKKYEQIDIYQKTHNIEEMLAELFLEQFEEIIDKNI